MHGRRDVDQARNKDRQARWEIEKRRDGAQLGEIEKQGAQFNKKTEEQGARLNTKIEEQGAQLNTKIEEQGTQLNNKFEKELHNSEARLMQYMKQLHLKGRNDRLKD